MVFDMLRAVALILAIVAFTGCEQRRETPSRFSSDLDLQLAHIFGVRIGMTPRKLHNQIAQLGLEESNFNSETLRDIINKFDYPLGLIVNNDEKVRMYEEKVLGIPFSVLATT